jgi:hypothetical protein
MGEFMFFMRLHEENWQTITLGQNTPFVNESERHANCLNMEGDLVPVHPAGREGTTLSSEKMKTNVFNEMQKHFRVNGHIHTVRMNNAIETFGNWFCLSA